jgi:HEAT repeat protein
VPTFLRNVVIDRNSFWLGFLASVLLIWILSRSRVYIPGLFKRIKVIATSMKNSLSTGTERRLLMDIVRCMQRQHLTSMMFSLDEIIIEPQLMVPPTQVSYSNQTLPIDTVNLTIPYIPDWPELGAIYQTPKISIYKALQNGANIALAGNPGSGKTVSLSYLASQIARRSPAVGALGNLVPIYVHAVDINPPTVAPHTPANFSEQSNDIRDKPTSSNGGQSLISVIIDAVSHQFSSFIQPRLTAAILSALSKNQLIILLDGLDELASESIHNIHLFIKALLLQYPTIRMVASVSFENLAELPSLGFHVMALAEWGDLEINEFVKKWNRLWEKLPTTRQQNPEYQSIYKCLYRWLTTARFPTTPLDMTLKIWAAYSGDLIGPDSHSALEAYLRRMTGDNQKSRAALERLALQIVVSMNPAYQPHHNDTILEPYVDGKDQSTDAQQAGISTQEHWRGKPIPFSGDLVSTGLLQSHSGSRLRFINPILTGYLAGNALVNDTSLTKIQEQTSWIGKSTTLYYLAHFGDISAVIPFLLRRDDFLHNELLRIARWLRAPRKNQPWRALVLRTLATALQREKETLPLAARIITAIAISGEPGVSLLFRQLLQSDNLNLRNLAALASGISADPKAADDLAALLADKSPTIVRSASLALVAIGSKHSLEIIANSLLHGSEIMRRAAAEALANHPAEGHPTLQEGSTVADLRVRHAIVYGLMRIQQPWAREILERLQLEDKEWIVRTAAIQAMEEINLPSAYVPNPLPDLTETPWLVDFAAKQGMGVAPGEPAYELVIEALRKGSEEEKIQALIYLSFHGNAKSIPVIYSWYFGGTGEIRDTACQTLWTLVNSGITLPPPQQYGFDVNPKYNGNF